MKQENSTNRCQTTVPKPGSDEAVLQELIRRRGNRWVLKQAVGREGVSWVITHISNDLELDAEAALAANSPYPSRSYALECAKSWSKKAGQLRQLVEEWEQEPGETMADIVDDLAWEEFLDAGVHDVLRDDNDVVKLN